MAHDGPKNPGFIELTAPRGTPADRRAGSDGRAGSWKHVPMSNVLITGASTGIGQACALRLDRGGHRVFAGVRKPEDADRLAAQASSRLVPVILDICDADQIAAAATTIDAQVGASGLDGLVNNAGIGIGGPLEFLPIDAWRTQFEVNVIGQVAVTQAMMPMLRGATGRIVFIGSISGRVSTPMLAPYAASKHAIEAIGSALSGELRRSGMRVAVVEPGAIATAIWGKGRSQADEIEESLPPEAIRRYGGEVAHMRKLIDHQDRVGIDPVKVAEAVEHALFHRRPKLRYLVGTDAKGGAVLSRLLPDRALAALLRRVSP